MEPLRDQSLSQVKPAAVLIAILAAIIGTMVLLIGAGASSPLLWVTAITESIAAVAIVVAAGGFGYLALKPLLPKETPTLLAVVTSCVAGLWILSTAVLAIGSFSNGLLTRWMFWPIIAAGIAAAGWQGRRKTRSAKFTGTYPAAVFIWMLIAAAGTIAVVGALHPPAWWAGLADEYDVLEYHLQIPRQFYTDGHIAAIDGNVYSHYPLGVEMLFLLGMCLRGGAYEGMYLAKFMHLIYGALAAAGIYAAFKKDDDVRGRFAAGLLATTPFLVYLSWLAMVELAQVACLAVAAGWLWQWLKDRSMRSAAIIGLMLGAACATKYLAAGFVVLPVLAAMMLVSLKSAKGLAGVGVAIATTLLMFSPWLIRNASLTGNPIFPLATNVFGAGDWDSQTQQRWVDGHGPRAKPPVPTPDWYKPAATPTRLNLFVSNFLANEKLGHITMVLAALAFCVWVARAGPTDLFNAAMLVIVAVQFGVWIFFTRGMPSRFIVPIAVPLAALAAGALADFSRVRSSPLSPLTKPVFIGPWGAAPALTALGAAMIVNLLVCGMWYKFSTQQVPPAHGLGGSYVAENIWPWNEAHQLPGDSRIMLIGEAKGFYFPEGTVYATAFDAHPLAEMVKAGLGTDEILDRLRDRGITHIWVSWPEMWRLAGTYGYPPELVGDSYHRRLAGGPIGTDTFDLLGLEVVKHLHIPAASPQVSTQPVDSPKTWPVVTIYKLPG